MKKKIRTFIIFVLLLIFCSCLLIAKKIKAKYISEAKYSSTPNFVFLTTNRSTFSNKDLDYTKTRIIINYFSPNCEHCQYMASEFLKDSQKLKDVQILMITSADSSSAARFITDYKLSLLYNIVIVRDTNFQFQKIFASSIVPSFFIYEHNKLVKKVIGETKIDNLLK